MITKGYRAFKKHFEMRRLGENFSNDATFGSAKLLSQLEQLKTPLRYDIINFLSEKIQAQNYLEIGVRNPDDNFNLINIKNKYSVDPGLEFILNPVDFKMTSDEFFLQLKENKLNISKEIKFDIIFIDGLHLADQVEKDIANSIQFLSEDGCMVIHDCNPPTEYHARETFGFHNSPAGDVWNGTTWKAFVKVRTMYYSCCIDSDWGVGIISKKDRPCFNILQTNENKFFEFSVFNAKRIEQLNLLSFEKFSSLSL